MLQIIWNPAWSYQNWMKDWLWNGGKAIRLLHNQMLYRELCLLSTRKGSNCIISIHHLAEESHSTDGTTAEQCWNTWKITKMLFYGRITTLCCFKIPVCGSHVLLQDNQRLFLGMMESQQKNHKHFPDLQTTFLACTLITCPANELWSPTAVNRYFVSWLVLYSGKIVS